MFHNFPARKNKQQKHSKTSQQEYIYTSDEPVYGSAGVLSAELEAEMQGSIHEMRQQFKRAAKKIRDLYSDS